MNADDREIEAQAEIMARVNPAHWGWVSGVLGEISKPAGRSPDAPTDRAVILCGPPKGCTCPAVAWTCCCEASEHGRRMIAGLPCDCGLCPATQEVDR